MQVVDFTNPAAPAIIASTPDALGGKLQDITLLKVLGSTLTFGADVFFVNGVPIVDVGQPNNPIPRAILNFAGFRDDNGHGIDADFSYVYMTGERGVSDLGTTGDTRLYIGQYNQIIDNGGIPPVVVITFPTTTTTLIQGQTITFSVNATDDVAVASVTLLVDGNVICNLSSPPYQCPYTVPMSATMLTFGATARDFGNNLGTAQNVPVKVIPDPLTTAKGRVVTTSGGTPVPGATVSALGISAITAADGTFSIPGLPTIKGSIVVNAIGVLAGVTLAGSSAPVAPVVGGITTIGDIQVGPKPLITSITPKSALAGTPGVSMTVHGANFTGATFAFTPNISITQPMIAADGASAILSFDLPLASVGTFALVASSPAGTTDTTVTQVDRFTSVDPNSMADTDGDGFQDVIEAVFGTDPLDPSSFPVIPAATETESVAFSVLNAPVTGAGIIETESTTFSLLNAPVTGAGIIETESTTFSVLNSPVTGGLTETESMAFSVLNAPAGTSGILEAESYFSVLNQFKPSAKPAPTQTEVNQGAAPGQSAIPTSPTDPFLDSDGDGLPDWFELLIGTDPFNPDTDGDGLTDYEEVFVYHTNPLLADTDGDGFNDGEEVLFGSDPLDPNSTPFNLKPRAVARHTSTQELAKNSVLKGDTDVTTQARKTSRSKVPFVSRFLVRFAPRRIGN